MTTELSEEQRKAVEQRPGAPVDVVDSTTHAHYVLISAAEYQRVRALFEVDEFDVSEAYPLVDEVASKEGWNDSEMDAYDRLDPRRAP